MSENEQPGSQPTGTGVRSLLPGLALAIVIFLIDIQIPLGVAGGVPYIAVVLLAQWSSRKNVLFHAALLSSLLTVLGFFLSPPGGELWKVLTNRGLALFAIWVTAVLSQQRRVIEEKREKAVRERQEAQAQLKILRGLLPICASCKKIRDDKGAWNQIEAYIRDHSEAEFSHGICPDCAERLYPEFYRKGQVKRPEDDRAAMTGPGSRHLRP